MQDEFLIHLREGQPCVALRPAGGEAGRRRAGHVRLPPLPARAARAGGDRRA